MVSEEAAVTTTATTASSDAPSRQPTADSRSREVDNSPASPAATAAPCTNYLSVGRLLSYQWFGPTTCHLQYEFYLLICLLLITWSGLQGLYPERNMKQQQPQQQPVRGYENEALYHSANRRNASSDTNSEFAYRMYWIMTVAWLSKHLVYRFLCVSSDRSTHANPTLLGSATHFWTTYLSGGGHTFDRPTTPQLFRQIRGGNTGLPLPRGIGGGTVLSSSSSSSTWASFLSLFGLSPATSSSSILVSGAPTSLVSSVISLIIDPFFVTVSTNQTQVNQDLQSPQYSTVAWNTVLPSTLVYVLHVPLVYIWYPLLAFVQGNSQTHAQHRMWLDHQQKQQQAQEPKPPQQQQQPIPSSSSSRRVTSSHRSSGGSGRHRDHRGSGGAGGHYESAAVLDSTSGDGTGTVTSTIHNIWNRLRYMFVLQIHMFHVVWASYGPTWQCMLPLLIVGLYLNHAYRLVYVGQPMLTTSSISMHSSPTTATVNQMDGSSTTTTFTSGHEDPTNVVAHSRRWLTRGTDLTSIDELWILLTTLGTLLTFLKLYRVMVPIPELVAGHNVVKDLRISTMTKLAKTSSYFSSSSSASAASSAAGVVVPGSVSILGGGSNHDGSGGGGGKGSSHHRGSHHHHRGAGGSGGGGRDGAGATAGGITGVSGGSHAMSYSRDSMTMDGTVAWSERARPIRTEGRFALMRLCFVLRLIDNLFVCVFFPRWSSYVCHAYRHCSNGITWTELSTVLFPIGIVSPLRPDANKGWLATSSLMTGPYHVPSLFWTVLGVVIITALLLLAQALYLNRSYIAMMSYLASEWTFVTAATPEKLTMENTALVEALTRAAATGGNSSNNNANNVNMPNPWDPRKKYKKGDLVLFPPGAESSNNQQQSQRYYFFGLIRQRPKRGSQQQHQQHKPQQQSIYQATTNQPEGVPVEFPTRRALDVLKQEFGAFGTSRIMAALSMIQIRILVIHVVIYVMSAVLAWCWLAAADDEDGHGAPQSIFWMLFWPSSSSSSSSSTAATTMNGFGYTVLAHWVAAYAVATIGTMTPAQHYRRYRRLRDEICASS